MWSFTRFSEYGNLRWKMFGVLNRWSIMGGGHLRDVPSMVIRGGNFWCCRSVVTYGRWSLTKCGRLRDVPSIVI